MNTPVSFEIAKSLKEKGYRLLPSFQSSYPTIADVVMWLYEKHGIWISVDATFPNSECFFTVRITNLTNGNGADVMSFKSPAEAYEAAIEYTLNNLI